jgi:GTP-binding protein HflX
VPQWLVFNKIDNLPSERQPLEQIDLYEVDGLALRRLFVSAQSGEGVSNLRKMLADEVSQSDSKLETPVDPRFALDNFGENSDEIA